MADFLKTFIEGEDILASDANSNNQYLLSKLSDNVAQVQNYVEGEVASIQSNVASVQATLQNEIDENQTELLTRINSVFSAIAPNYSAGIKLTTTGNYTVPAYGWIYWTGDGGSGPYYLKINGTNRLSAGALADHDHINVVIPFWVEPGDVITPPSGSTNKLGTYFYPCKGFVDEEVE